MEESVDTIQVLNQKCNREFRISYTDARLHNNTVKKVPESKMLQPGDVLINSTGVGTAGRVAQIWDIPVPTTIDGHMILMRPTEEVDPLYYGYAVMASQRLIESYAEGSTGQTELNKNRLKDDIIIRFPTDKKIQYRIARILAAIDERINVNTAINKNLAEQVHAIYQSWFNLYTQCGEMCPKTWTKATLGDIATISTGKRPIDRSEKLTESTFIPLVGATSIMGYTSKSNYVDRILVIGRVGTHGVVQRFNAPCWASDNTLVIKSKYYEYTCQILQGIDYTKLNRGSTQPLITQSDLAKSVILLPDKESLQEFEEVAGSLMSNYEANSLQNIKISSLRETILPLLLSGELDVSKLTL